MSLEKINEYAFSVPLMFEGDRGSGKTYDVRAFARSQGLSYLEIAGNESLEAFDFLGHVMQTEHGMVWKDGKLSQAFRLASRGVKAVLLIDEMLRIPQRHLSVLLSALSPDMDGNYRLQTGRMSSVVDGIGVEEELLAPAHMVAIFATTNVGPEFAIDDLDPAVAERFIILRKDTEQAALIKILKEKASAKGFSPLIALKLAEFFNKTQRMVKTGTLNRHATTRTLARAIEAAKTEAGVKGVLRDQILLWADRDSSGYPVEQQVSALNKTIDELFAELEREAQQEKDRDARALLRQRAALVGALDSVAKSREEADARARGEADDFEEVDGMEFDDWEMEEITGEALDAGGGGARRSVDAARIDHEQEAELVKMLRFIHAQMEGERSRGWGAPDRSTPRVFETQQERDAHFARYLYGKERSDRDDDLY